MKLLDIYSRMKRDIGYIEQELEKSIDTDYAPLRESSGHLLKAGGKRIRPVFVLLAGQFGRYDMQRLKHVAVALELIHMATLVHDDVIDDADTRRGQLTVKSKWDNRVAMYTGDYIFGRALLEVSNLSHPEIHRILSNAIVEMCIGEIEQIRFFFNTDQTMRDYLLRIKRKTALLIAVSSQLGALAADADENVADALYRFGYYVGMAFQIKDDLLDLTGTEKQIGKPPGSDVRQGNITLPVLLALREPGRRQAILEEIAMIRDSDGKADPARFLQLVRTSQGILTAESMTERYLQKALRMLNRLPESRSRKDLQEIAVFIGSRTY